MKEKATIKAKYSPKLDENISSILLDAKGKITCEWTYAFTVNKVPYYEANDIKFPSLDAFPITDLLIVE